MKKYQGRNHWIKIIFDNFKIFRYKGIKMDMEAIEKTLIEIEEFRKNMMTRQDWEEKFALVFEKQNKIMTFINEMFERQRARNARYYEEFKQDK